MLSYEQPLTISPVSPCLKHLSHTNIHGLATPLDNHMYMPIIPMHGQNSMSDLHAVVTTKVTTLLYCICMVLMFTLGLESCMITVHTAILSHATFTLIKHSSWYVHVSNYILITTMSCIWMK